MIRRYPIRGVLLQRIERSYRLHPGIDYLAPKEYERLVA